MENPNPDPPSPPEREAVWKFRGYELRPSEFTTAMVHYYRAEIQRSNTWRTRLDATTNWAVLATSAAISFALASPNNHFGVLLLNMALVTIFLGIEARRYRYFELWSYRARLLETDFFAAMLVPPFTPHAEWAESLATSLLQPEFPISNMEAFGRRLRRNYLWIYLVLLAAWIMKIYLHPTPATGWEDLVFRSAVGDIPGTVTFLGMFLFCLILLVVALYSLRLHESSGEVLPKYPGMTGKARVSRGDEKSSAQLANRPGFRLFQKRQQVMVWIVTDHAEGISRAILEQMKRGVTALKGTGKFSGSDHDVLMTGITITEVAELKSIVQTEDPGAFVVVNPVQDIFGKGFQALDKHKR